MFIGKLNFVVDSFPGVTHRHLSDHMSELVENTLNDLEQSKVKFTLPLYIRDLSLTSYLNLLIFMYSFVPAFTF